MDKKVEWQIIAEDIEIPYFLFWKKKKTRYKIFIDGEILSLKNISKFRFHINTEEAYDVFHKLINDSIFKVTHRYENYLKNIYFKNDENQQAYIFFDIKQVVFYGNSAKIISSQTIRNVPFYVDMANKITIYKITD